MDRDVYLGVVEMGGNGIRKNRIEYLDGMRGGAIILVFLFHAFARWPTIVPYRNVYADISCVKYGWLGVELFFMISGFVIFMTVSVTHGTSIHR